MNDYEALRALVQRYARAADARDIDALVSLFHPDAVIEGSRGVQPLDEWLDVMRQPSRWPTSMHVLGDPLIDLTAAALNAMDPDGGTLDADTPDAGTLDTYAVVYQLGDPADGPADLTLGIRYLDQVVRHGGQWRIRHRVARTLWMR